MNYGGHTEYSALIRVHCLTNSVAWKPSFRVHPPLLRLHILLFTPLSFRDPELNLVIWLCLLGFRSLFLPSSPKGFASRSSVSWFPSPLFFTLYSLLLLSTPSSLSSPRDREVNRRIRFLPGVSKFLSPVFGVFSSSLHSVVFYVSWVSSPVFP